MMGLTWIVIVRETGATVWEQGDAVRRFSQIATTGESPQRFAHRVARYLEQQATTELPTHVVLLAAPRYLGPLRLALPTVLAERVRIASNALPREENRAELRAMLAPLVS